MKTALDMFGHPIVFGEKPKMGADARRTRRQRQSILNGVHPMGAPLLKGKSATCGTCANLCVREFSRRYFKCKACRCSASPATDVRLKWPACIYWKPKEG